MGVEASQCSPIHGIVWAVGRISITVAFQTRDGMFVLDLETWCREMKFRTLLSRGPVGHGTASGQAAARLFCQDDRGLLGSQWRDLIGKGEKDWPKVPYRGVLW